MNKKIFENSRICPKGDVEANWNKAVGFIPLDKEIIIYKKDDTHPAARFKVGDGKTSVQDLPFSGTDMAAIEKLIDEKGELLIEYVDNVADEKSEQLLEHINDVSAEHTRLQKELNKKVTICTLNIINSTNTVYFRHLNNVTEIDWGDGTITHASDIPNTWDKTVTHTYTNIGEYTCKIYDATKIRCGREDLSGESALVKIIVADTIDDLRLAYNHSLTYIELPKNMSIISNVTMYMCDKLTNIRIPDGVTSIGDYAFGVCSSLTSIEIPDGVTSIGSGAIEYCEKLKSIKFKNSTPIEYQTNWFNYCGALTNIYVPYGSQQAYKEKWAEGGASQNILDKIVESDREAMMSDLNEQVAEAIQPIIDVVQEKESIQATFDITEDNTIIELGTVSGAGFTKINWGDGNVNNELSHTYIKPGKYICRFYGSTSTGFETLKYCKNLTDTIVNIPMRARTYVGCSNLKNVELCKDTPTIASESFYDCSSLKNIIIPNSVTSIENGAFQNCSSLTSVVIPNSVTSIGAHAFQSCSGLTSIEIPDSVTSMGTYAFAGCSSLISIEIPDSVTHIPEHAFGGCSGLTSVTIGDSVTRINFDAFRGCSNLTRVVIPDSVTSIDIGAFRDCSSLTEIILGTRVSGILMETFRNCTSLNSITFKNTNPITYNAISFNDFTALTQIYVPYGCKQAYINKWLADGAPQDILDKIVESDREAMMSDVIVKMNIPETDEEKAAACETIGAVAKQANAGSMNIVYGEEHSGRGSKMFTIASGGTGAETIPMRNANGQFDVREPQSDLNVVNKKYAEDNFVAKPPSGTGLLYQTAEGETQLRRTAGDVSAWTIVERGAGGVVRCATPVDDTDSANKSYVDGLIAELLARIEALEGK